MIHALVLAIALAADSGMSESQNQTVTESVVIRHVGSPCAAYRFAVKQYAWSRVIRWSGRSSRGRCFHVTAGTGDQIYRPTARPSIEVWQAVNATWRWTLRRRDGTLIHTDYRAGARGIRCAGDAGRRLYARSARRCALAGWSTTTILLRYYRHRQPVLWR